MATSLSLATELLQRLDAVIASILTSSREEALDHLLVARLSLADRVDELPQARLRMDVEGGLAALESLPLERRLPLLARLQSLVPPSTGLTSIVRKSSILDFHSSANESPPIAPHVGAAIAIWSGHAHCLPDREAMDDATRAAACYRAITPTFPRDAEALDALCADLTETLPDPELGQELVDLLVARWFELHDFAHTDADFRLVDRLSCPEAWLTAIAAMLGHGPVPRAVVEPWIARAEPAWRAASTPSACALADARLAAIVGAAGDMPSAEGLLRHALFGLGQDNDLAHRAALYETVMRAAAALPTRQLDAPGLGPWLDVIDKLLTDRALLRNQQAFFLARLAALRTLPRVARVLPEAVDRGQQSLRELCRRVPDPWLDLLHLATTAHLQTRANRSNEVQIAALSDLLRRDGLPTPHPAIPLEEVLAHLAEAAPDHLGRLADRIAQPAAKARWLAASVTALGTRH
jgi:hypothetical protein